jgi:signal transduction histidine kinase
MTIRNRLTIQFFFLVFGILSVSTSVVYFYAERHRKEDFYARLRSKAESTAKLLITVDEISASLLRKIETDNPSALPGEGILIWNPRNQVIFDFDPNDILSPDPAFLDQIRKVGEVRFEQNGFEVLGYVFRESSGKFVVMIAAEDVFGKSRISDLKWVLLTVFIASLGFILLAGWFYAGRAMLPISRIIEQVKKITISRLDLRLEKGVQADEISRLSETFNHMLERLESGLKIQKDFIANASHELRTPLTAMTGQLEVALLNERSPERYKEVLSSVLEDIRNLNKTSNRLLLLAQADTEERALEMEPFRIDDLIWQCQEDLQKLKPNWKVLVDIDFDQEEEEHLQVVGNPLLLKTALLNLMENGCKYAHDNLVKVHIKPQDKGLMILFADNGQGIPAEDLPFIFQPFFRASNASGFPGNGIGLSLVDKIARLHRGSIHVDSELGKGTSFRLFLPGLN